MVNFTFSLHNFEYFLLILVRITSFVFVAPFFGDSAVPSRVKIGLSVFVALFMYNIVNKPDLDYTSSVGYSIIVVREVITGLLIGFAAYICNSIILSNFSNYILTYLLYVLPEKVLRHLLLIF